MSKSKLIFSEILLDLVYSRVHNYFLFFTSRIEQEWTLGAINSKCVNRNSGIVYLSGSGDQLLLDTLPDKRGKFDQDSFSQALRVERQRPQIGRSFWRETSPWFHQDSWKIGAADGESFYLDLNQKPLNSLTSYLLEWKILINPTTRFAKMMRNVFLYIFNFNFLEMLFVLQGLCTNVLHLGLGRVHVVFIVAG